MLNLDSCELLLSRLPIQHRESGQLVPFVPNYNQWLMKEQLKQHQVKLGGKVRGISVKARRVGVSSQVDAWGVCHIAERENATAWIVACLAETSKELFRVPTDLVNHWPWTLPAPLSTRITYPHPGGDSILTMQTAKSIISGRGPTLSFLHLSEAAFYPGGESFLSLLPSVSDDPGTVIFIESTANGKAGQGETFWNLWEAAERGDSEYLAIFLTWLDDPTCRRPTDELDINSIHDEDERNIIQLICLTHARANRGCSSLCGRCKYCNKSLECIAWRRWALANICERKVEKFRREYPVNSEEAFYSTSAPAFTPNELRKAESTICDPIAIGRLELDTSSYGQTGTGKPVFTADPTAPLHIWAMPKPSLHYYFGFDAARGMEGRDYAAGVGWCGETGEQVARYYSHIGPEILARLAHILGTFYNNAMINIELTGNLGLWAQKVLRDTYKYRNFYRWKGRDDRVPTFRIINSIGWETTTRARDMMLSSFRSGIHHGSCIIRDIALLNQMRAMEMVGNKWEVPAKIHDDIFVAGSIGWIAKEQWHSTFTGGVVKQTLEEESSSPDPTAEAKSYKAKGDVEAAVQAHWRKMLAHIRSGGKQLALVGRGEGTRAVDRLAGI